MSSPATATAASLALLRCGSRRSFVSTSTRPRASFSQKSNSSHTESCWTAGELVLASAAVVAATSISGSLYQLYGQRYFDQHDCPSTTSRPLLATMAFSSASQSENLSSGTSGSRAAATQRSSTKHAPATSTTTAAGTNKHHQQAYAAHYDISVRAIKGGRVTMEDTYCIGDGGRLAAVFDGHGGGGVSSLLQREFYPTLQRHLPSNDSSVFEWVAALKAAFGELEDRVLLQPTLHYQGSTAVAVWLHPQGTLLAANLGDSRAVLSRAGRALELTRDHKPNHAAEKERLLKMGETIEWDKFAKVHRVRNLSLSRAIGDAYAKPAVSAAVEIHHYPLIKETDDFVILASDGLWDVVSSDEAVQYVHERLENNEPKENSGADQAYHPLVLRRTMAKHLAREAVRRGSGDNVCVVIVWLKDLQSSSS